MKEISISAINDVMKWFPPAVSGLRACLVPTDAAPDGPMASVARPGTDQGFRRIPCYAWISRYAGDQYRDIYAYDPALGVHHAIGLYLV